MQPGKPQTFNPWRLSVAPMMDRCEKPTIMRVAWVSCALSVQFFPLDKDYGFLSTSACEANTRIYAVPFSSVKLALCVPGMT